MTETPIDDHSANPLAILPERGKLIGLDLGTKTIGVAVSDGLRMTATPLETIRRTKFTADAARLRQIVDETGAVGFVLGLPLNMDGSEGPRVQSTRAFARNLAGLISLPLAFWDERLSTSAVTRMMIEADLQPRQAARRAGRQAGSQLHPAGRARQA
jgi:putative Holliday junction resolvase